MVMMITTIANTLHPDFVTNMFASLFNVPLILKVRENLQMNRLNGANKVMMVMMITTIANTLHPDFVTNMFASLFNVPLILKVRENLQMNRLNGANKVIPNK
jgi:hypothetical protein